MLPPSLDSIATDLRASFRSFVAADASCTELPELLTAEEMVTEFVRALGRGMLQDFADVRLEQAMASRERCSCGRLRESLKKKSWPHSTPCGDIEVTDPYTYCRTCKSSARPAQAWLGTEKERWSLLVQEFAIDFAADESCERAVAKLERHHPGIEMGRTTALRLLHEHGAEARKFIDAKHKKAVSDYLKEGSGRSVAPEVEVQYDGGMVPVATLETIAVEEGKAPELTPVRGLPKRRKVTAYQEVKAGLAERPGQDERHYCARPTDQLDACFKDLFAIACIEGWDQSTQTRGISDGAIYIRPRMEDCFDVGNFRFILDRPHCKEHLSAAGTVLEKKTGVAAQQWATQALEKAEAGHADEIVAELTAAHEEVLAERAGAIADKHPSLFTEEECERLRLEAGYFERNKDATAYAEYRDCGWSTASSEIESAHDHLVQARMKISGAWWHPDNVDNILALRLLKANGWWLDYWAHRRSVWRDKASVLAASRPTA
jgi:hypothetical protein